MNTKNISLFDSSSSGQSTVFELLQESINREKKLKRFLDEQLKENDRLRLELEMERKKSQVNFNSISDVSTEESESNIQTSNMLDMDLKETFGTNSSMLMQFKYDELRISYNKCVRKLVKKTNQLKKVLREAEIQKFINFQLDGENQELNKKIELVGFRYFDLMDRRSEEQTMYRNSIEELRQKLLLSNQTLEMRNKRTMRERDNPVDTS